MLAEYPRKKSDQFKQEIRVEGYADVAFNNDADGNYKSTGGHIFSLISSQ